MSIICYRQWILLLTTLKGLYEIDNPLKMVEADTTIRKMFEFERSFIFFVLTKILF